MNLTIFIILFKITCIKSQQELTSQRGDDLMRRKRNRIKNRDIYDKVASNIKKYRMASGISQQVVADRAGYSHEYIRRIEAPNCKKYFTIEAVYLIAKALNIDVYKLFDFKKESDD